MIEQEKRNFIRKACETQAPGCKGCPYSKHRTAWCRRGTAQDIPATQLNNIILVFNMQRGILNSVAVDA